MSWAEEKAGRELLNKWNASSQEIQISLTGERALWFRFEGTFSEFLKDKLHVAGVKCECVLDLSEVTFQDVVTENRIQQSELSPESYPESVTISLAPVGKFVLSTLPPLRADSRPNDASRPRAYPAT
jgi:hypothetical protein